MCHKLNTYLVVTFWLQPEMTWLTPVPVVGYKMVVILCWTVIILSGKNCVFIHVFCVLLSYIFNNFDHQNNFILCMHHENEAKKDWLVSLKMQVSLNSADSFSTPHSSSRLFQDIGCPGIPYLLWLWKKNILKILGHCANSLQRQWKDRNGWIMEKNFVHRVQMELAAVVLK